jgi:MraZ protein
VFRGIQLVSMDRKNRLTIPARFKSTLDAMKPDACQQLVITIDTEDPCLAVYPIEDWEKIEKKIEGLPSFNPATRRIKRLLMGHATEIELDRLGRLLLPNVLKSYAQLEKKVVLVGQGKKFELWSEQGWEAKRSEWLSEDNKLGDQSDLNDLVL